MKHEWKKQEKQFYLPKNKPEIIEIPEMKFFTVSGEGNPNDEALGEYIGVLYSLSYAVRMSPKKGLAPDGYFEYTVYPLEGVWSLTKKGIAENDGSLNKDHLAFTLMIRQPDFVTYEYALETIERLKKNKPHELLEKADFQTLAEGKCIQMLHNGPYDDEPESFAMMEEYAESIGVKRLSKNHREIYLSDARKTEPVKLKTVLRFECE